MEKYGRLTPLPGLVNGCEGQPGGSPDGPRQPMFSGELVAPLTYSMEERGVGPANSLATCGSLLTTFCR